MIGVSDVGTPAVEAFENISSNRIFKEKTNLWGPGIVSVGSMPKVS